MLQCQKCHVLGAIPADQRSASLAPDLRMAHERLKPEWVLEWLKNPSEIQPGTRMPQFWPSSAVSEVVVPAARRRRRTRRFARSAIISITFRGGPSPETAGGIAEHELGFRLRPWTLPEPGA